MAFYLLKKGSNFLDFIGGKVMIGAGQKSAAFYVVSKMPN